MRVSGVEYSPQRRCSHYQNWIVTLLRTTTKTGAFGIRQSFFAFLPCAQLPTVHYRKSTEKLRLPCDATTTPPDRRPLFTKWSIVQIRNLVVAGRNVADCRNKAAALCVRRLRHTDLLWEQHANLDFSLFFLLSVWELEAVFFSFLCGLMAQCAAKISQISLNRCLLRVSVCFLWVVQDIYTAGALMQESVWLANCCSR